MTPEEIMRSLGSLPPEAQREVEDFIAFLRERNGRLELRADQGAADWSADGFVGMWQDHDEMQDSHAWVRGVRETEW